jgi:SAM-dependent methyltransferase
MRARGIAADLASTALTQVALRRRALGKFGPAAGRMFFTRTGLEQATRAAVADRRAARLAGAGVRTLADLCCGLGADALAAARAGIRVYAVEADPHTAALAAANAEALGLADRISVTVGDARAFDASGVDAVFCDPARRRAGTRRRLFDPDDYSPPWDFVLGLASRVPRTVVKAAPGVHHDLIPSGAEGEWVSVDGDVVEAALWCGPLARTPRRATVLSTPARTGGSNAVEGTGGSGRGVAGVAQLSGPPGRTAPVGGVRRFLYDPDGAVVRAHLVAAFAATVDGVLADPTIAYVYTDVDAPTPFARRLRVRDAVPFSLKRLRGLLRDRRIGSVEILKRGSALRPEQLRRDLRLSGDGAATLVLTRVAGAPTVLICDAVA